MSQITIHDSDYLPEKTTHKILLSPEHPDAEVLEILPVHEEDKEQGAGSMGENLSPLRPAPCTPASSATTGNEIMARIAQACENLGYELLDDGIYFNDKRLVEIVYRQGVPCFVQTLFLQPEVKSSSLDLLDKPFGELTPDEWQMLQVSEPVPEFVAA